MARADAAARALLREFQVVTAPIDPFALARSLDVQVVPQGLDDDASGMLLRRDGRCVIGVNRTHSPLRRRFTVAHEIAHAILHPDMIGDGITDDAMWRSGLPDSVEYQANRMAADILMPEHLVREHFKVTKDPAALARIFEVSNKSMTIRLERLRLE